MKHRRKAFILITLIFLGVTLAACKRDISTGNKEVTIYLTRHGKTMLNATDRVQGWSDSPLTYEGVASARYLGKGISRSVKFDEIYSSDSGRAIETAKIIAKAAKQKISLTQDKRLREFNYGSYEGAKNEKMWKAVAKANGQALLEYQANFKRKIATGIPKFADKLAKIDKKNTRLLQTYPAENYSTVTSRMKEALDGIVTKAQKKNEKNILVVSHGMSIAALLIKICPKSADQIPSEGLTNASISKIVYKNGKYIVKTVNDTSYISNGR